VLLATDSMAPSGAAPRPEPKVFMRSEMSVPWASSAMVPPAVRSGFGCDESALTATP